MKTNISGAINKVFDEERKKVFLKLAELFVHFPYRHLHPIITTKGIPLFDIHDLASNKAYSMGHRPAWRDYVDIFFILKKGIRLETIIQEAKKRFEGKFDEKLFLEQLVYIKDIQDFSTSYISKSYTPEEIKKFFEKETERYLAQKIS